MSNVKQLPDAYKQDGNHKKMLELNEALRDVFMAETEAVLECLDIDKATGMTLDKLGETVNQKRGSLNDEQYRIMIRFKIAKLLNQGDYNSLMSLAVFLLGCEKGDLVIHDVGNATVEITSLPFATLLEAGFTSEQVIQFIKELLPCGVKIKEANFIGTFILSDWNGELVHNENEGFGNIEQTMGGHLGLVINDNGNIILPD